MESEKKNFCTVFDTKYAAFGVSLFRSLQRHEKNFELFVLCMDDMIFDVLTKLAEPGLTPISRKGFYEDIYRSVENRMNYAQKCWLAQPLTCEWLLDHRGLDHVIYMDSDCYFFSSPSPIFQEMEAAKPVAATMVPHHFSPSLELKHHVGHYCTQFNYFNRSPESRRVLEKWKSDNLKYDKDKRWEFPGQTSLDDWKALEPTSLEIRNPKAGVAVWNLEWHHLRTDREPIIFYHFHGLHFPAPDKYDLGNYKIPPEVVELVYRPYLKEVEQVNSELEARFPGNAFVRRNLAMDQSNRSWKDLLLDRARTLVRTVRRRWQGTYNVFAREGFFLERKTR